MVLAERFLASQRSERTDREKIEDDVERNVFSFLQERLNERIPGAQLHYESTTFSLERDDGSVSRTVPDFHIIKPSGKEIFIEVTRANRSIKNKKKQIMDNFPVKYVVWGRRELRNVQRAARRQYPQFTLVRRDRRVVNRHVVQSSK